MSGLFGSSAKAVPAAQNAPQYTGVDLQTSAYGKCLTIVFGATRISANLIGYWDFLAVPHVSANGQASGGKGGVFGSSGQNNGSFQISYTYQAALAFALCEGPITGFGTVYADKTQTTTAAIGFAEFLGPYPQTAWSYLTTNHPADAYGYNGVAYLGAASYQMGSSPQLPNHSFEVFGLRYHSVSGSIPDADPSLVVSDLLTNAKFGVPNFSQWVGSLASLQTYSLAANLLISPAYEQQRAARDIIDEIALMVNCDPVFTAANLLTFVPRGDETITGNGKTYVPPTSVYDFTDDDLLPVSGGPGTKDAPVVILRKRISDSLNKIQLEILDRSAMYRTITVEARDQAAINTFGLRQEGLKTAHLFADPTIGRASAQLQLQRQSIQNMYYFAGDLRFFFLDPGDIVTITHGGQSLAQAGVKIKTIQKQGNSFEFEAEEYLAATGTASAYSFSRGSGYSVNYNVDPGFVNTPLFFEPTDELGQGLTIRAAVSGGANWGGSEAWVATDPAGPFRRLDRHAGPATQGATITNAITAVTRNELGPTIDNTNTLRVDIAVSRGTLETSTSTDAIALNTLCYVGGEYIGYTTATLIGAGQYALTGLIRGCLGTDIAAHPIGSTFCRINGALFAANYTADRIGTTLHFKFLSFNQYGGGQQTLDTVVDYPYTITGLALSSPLPVVQNVRLVYEAGFNKIWWDEVQDFRTVFYEIRLGGSWDSGLVVGENIAHPPFVTFGQGTFWIRAVSQPAAGITVYSSAASMIAVIASTLVQNVVIGFDEAAAGWSGVKSAGLSVVGQNIILDPTVALTATYDADTRHIVDLGYVAPCQLSMNFRGIGVPTGQNVLAMADVLAQADILGLAVQQLVDVRPMIALSNDGVAYGAFQAFAPGVYLARFFKPRLVFSTVNTTATPVGTAFSFEIDPPDRLDHYLNQSIAAAGSTLVFIPDNATVIAPFNGGPNNSSLPLIDVFWQQQAGDQIVISGLTRSQVTIQFTNGGVGVSRDGVNITVEGY